jgi:hypothetical protein
MFVGTKRLLQWPTTNQVRQDVTTYQRIVFLQGEEADEALAILDQHGEQAAVDYLSQWDYGEAGEEFSEPASGDDDDVYETDNGYRMSYNTRIGYIGLEAIRA